VGFLKKADNTCIELLPQFVEVQFEIQTNVDTATRNETQSVIADAIKEAVLLTWINNYNITREYLIVEVVAIEESGRRLLVTAFRYMIVVRRIFPVGTSQAFVSETVVAIGNFSATDLEVLVTVGGGDVNGTQNVSRLDIKTTELSVQAIEGVLNLNLNEVVTCTLIPWYDTIDVKSKACDVTCSEDQEKSAVAYLDGLYILACVNKRAQTPVVQTTPPPVSVTETTTANWILYSLVIVIGVALMLVACICLMRRRPKGSF